MVLFALSFTAMKQISIIVMQTNHNLSQDKMVIILLCQLNQEERIGHTDIRYSTKWQSWAKNKVGTAGKTEIYFNNI